MNQDFKHYNLEDDSHRNPYREERPAAYGSHERADPASNRFCKQCGLAFEGANIGRFCSNCGEPTGLQPRQESTVTSGYAVASMVMGILSILSCGLYGLPTLVFAPLALVFASQAKKQVAMGQASASSLGMATAGRIMGIIGIAIMAAIVLTVIVAVVFGVGSATP